MGDLHQAPVVQKLDSAIHLFNNWDQVNTAGGSDFFICVIDCCIFFIGKDGKDGQNGKF